MVLMQKCGGWDIGMENAYWFTKLNTNGYQPKKYLSKLTLS